MKMIDSEKRNGSVRMVKKVHAGSTITDGRESRNCFA
jgi:hypothetical protein